MLVSVRPVPNIQIFSPIIHIRTLSAYYLLHPPKRGIYGSVFVCQHVCV